MTETVTFKQEETGPNPPPKTPEQEAADSAARAKVENKDAPPPTKKEVDEQLDPAKLAQSLADTKAELTRAQQELAKIKKGGEQKTEEKPGEQKTEEKPGEQSEADKAAQEAVAKSGLDISTWQQEFSTTGDVSEDGRAKIAESLKGQFGENARALVDEYIEGKKTAAANYNAEVLKTAGGQEKWAEMQEWGKSGLTKEEKIAFNQAVNSGNLASAQMAVSSLVQKYEAANGKEPSLLNGDNTVTGGQTGFASSFEMTQAMADPRYGKDPVYTKQVEQRAMRSNF